MNWKKLCLRLITLLLVPGLFVACSPGVDVAVTPGSNGDVTATAEIEVRPFSGQYRVIVDVANLRAGPGIEYEERGTLNGGDVITLNGISAAGDWYRTTAGGWIAAGFVAPADDAPTVMASPTDALQAADTPTPTNTPVPVVPRTPTPTAMVTPPPTTAGCPDPPASWVRYTVQAGDTLSQLAVATGSTVAQLQEVNCLVGTLIVSGQGLFVPRLPPTRTLVPADTPTLTNTPGPSETDTPTATETLEPVETLTVTATATPESP